MAEDELPGGPSPRWVSGEKYDRAYEHAMRLSRRVAALTEERNRLRDERDLWRAEWQQITDTAARIQAERDAPVTVTRYLSSERLHVHGDTAYEIGWAGECLGCIDGI